MIKNYAITDGRLVATDDENSNIQVFVSPSEADRLFLITELDIDEHALHGALDPDELSRIEFEPDHVAVIFKRPKHYSAEDNFMFTVSSIGLYLFKDRLIAVLDDDVSIFDPGKDVSRLTGLPDLLLRLIGRSISQFLGHLRAISMVVDELEEKLATSMNNQHLMHLFKLGQSLTYYLSALSSNGVMIEKLRSYSGRIGFTVSQNETLEDLLIDNTQCYKQAEIYATIMTGMSDARASVVSNNLNTLMKQLTILTIVFLPLNVIAGMFGMSEYTDFVQPYIPWWPVSYGLFTLGLIGIGYGTYWMLKRTGLD